MDLEEEYNRLNIEKFEGKLPHYDIKVVTPMQAGYTGKIIHTKKLIRIRTQKWGVWDEKTQSNSFVDLPDDEISNTLLHEMVHAEHFQIYGLTKAPHHPKEFWERLFELGGRKI